MDNKQITESYITKDFYIASLLRALGFRLQSLDRSQGKFVNFIFADPENKAQEAISQYWNRNIQVDARTMVEAINEFKTRLYAKT